MMGEGNDVMHYLKGLIYYNSFGKHILATKEFMSALEKSEDEEMEDKAGEFIFYLITGEGDAPTEIPKAVAEAFG